MIAKETLSVEQYSSNVTVMIKVEDRNDNSPRFSHRLYNVAIKEELPGGTEILQVTILPANWSACLSRFTEHENPHFLKRTL